MPAGRARERGFGAVPDGRERDNAAQRQVQRRNHIRGRRERAETTGQNLQRIVLPKRGLPQLRPPPLTRPYFARGAVAEGLLERRADEANAKPQVAHELGRGRVLRRLGREQSNAAGSLDLAAPIEHRLALGKAEADRSRGILPSQLVGIEERTFELRPESLRTATGGRRADDAG